MVNMNCSEMKVRFKRMYIVLSFLIVFGSLQSPEASALITAPSLLPGARKKAR